MCHIFNRLGLQIYNFKSLPVLSLGRNIGYVGPRPADGIMSICSTSGIIIIFARCQISRGKYCA